MDASFNKLSEPQRRMQVMDETILLNDKNDMAERKKMDKDKKMEGLKQEKDSRTKTLDAKNDNIRQLENKIDKRNQIMTSLKGQENFSKVEQQFILLQKGNAQINKEIEKLQKELNSVNQEIKRLKVAQEEEKQKCVAKEQFVSKDDIKGLQEDLAALKEEIKSLKDDRLKEEKYREGVRQIYGKIMNGINEIKRALEYKQLQPQRKSQSDKMSASELLNIEKASNVQVAFNQGSNNIDSGKLPRIEIHSAPCQKKKAFRSKSRSRAQKEDTHYSKR